jgi:hypothetical protein
MHDQDGDEAAGPRLAAHLTGRKGVRGARIRRAGTRIGAMHVDAGHANRRGCRVAGLDVHRIEAYRTTSAPSLGRSLSSGSTPFAV